MNDTGRQIYKCPSCKNYIFETNWEGFCKDCTCEGCTLEGSCKSTKNNGWKKCDHDGHAEAI